MNLFLSICLCMSFVLFSGSASSEDKTTKSTFTSEINAEKLLCPDADLWGKKLLTGICWDCLFPVRLVGVSIFPGDNDLPADVTEKFLCACNGKDGLPVAGITGGAWLPARLIEVVRKPYCSPALGGISFNDSVRLWGGHKDTGEDVAEKTFYNYHFWAFPLYMILDLFVQHNCNAGGIRSMDMMYMSEVDPTWNIDELSFFLNPEGVVFSNPAALAACTVDCAVTSVEKPMESLFWCAGCWGNLYPFVGGIASDGSPVRDTSLLSARILSGLHRRLQAHKTYGDKALCSGVLYPMLPKQQYKISTLFPIPEANNTLIK